MPVRRPRTTTTQALGSHGEVVTRWPTLVPEHSRRATGVCVRRWHARSRGSTALRLWQQTVETRTRSTCDSSTGRREAANCTTAEHPLPLTGSTRRA